MTETNLADKSLQNKGQGLPSSLLLTTPLDMNRLKENTPSSLNPPLRIFNPSSNGSTGQSSPRNFERPQLRNLVRHDRIARHFARREHSFGSSLD